MATPRNDDATLSLRLTSRPAQAFPLRSQLRDWLAAQDASEEEILDVLVAANEAFHNAVLHARTPQSIAVHVHASISGQVVEVVVRDFGRWDEAQRSSDSAGLGLPLMQALMDTVEVNALLDGTTVRLRRRIGAHLTPAEDDSASLTDRIELLHNNPIFAPMPAELLEPLAAQLIPFSVTGGETVIHEGDQGELFYLIADGRLDVSVDHRHVATLGPSQHVGEIALIREVPRTATIHAEESTKLYALTREDFVAAVGSHQASAREAQRLIRSRLAELQDVLGRSA
jgi:anti-sigma regulatory factor (Ser/Thr protein kinase)